MAKKSDNFGPKFPTLKFEILPLTWRKDPYKRVQLVEIYQNLPNFLK